MNTISRTTQKDCFCSFNAFNKHSHVLKTIEHEKRKPGASHLMHCKRTWTQRSFAKSNSKYEVCIKWQYCYLFLTFTHSEEYLRQRLQSFAVCLQEITYSWMTEELPHVFSLFFHLINDLYIFFVLMLMHCQHTAFKITRTISNG